MSCVIVNISKCCICPALLMWSPDTYRASWNFSPSCRFYCSLFAQCTQYVVFFIIFFQSRDCLCFSLACHVRMFLVTQTHCFIVLVPCQNVFQSRKHPVLLCRYHDSTCFSSNDPFFLEYVFFSTVAIVSRYSLGEIEDFLFFNSDPCYLKLLKCLVYVLCIQNVMVFLSTDA